MKTLQNKAFWRRKRAVLENQRDQVRNQADVATFFNALGLRLSMFQSLTKPAGNQIQSDSKSIDTAFEVISSYIYTLLDE